MRDIIGYGGGKGGGSSHTHYEAEDSLHSTAYARVLDLVSEGEILGLANGVQSVYLNQTPVQNADGSSNFSGVTVDFRAGTQDQEYIPGFPDVENEISVGVELKSGAPWVHAISNTELSAIRVTLGVPALSKADTTNGDILGYEVAYQIELSKDGGAYSVVLSNSFNGKTTSEYQRSARIDLPPATTGWQIRVTRLTPNANTVGIADTTTLVSYTEVIDAKLRYPMSAIVGLQVDAKQFQSIPTRAYDMFGRIIQVPSNYDPVARSYAGVWDGTFKPAWTDNPAWIFRDLVLHDRYGLGNRITAAQLDKWSLYKIARYCDEMVPNGRGGTEPRFTCNLYLQTRKQAYAVLQDIASIFRGISYWGAGSIIASADMPADPVYVYTAANVIGGKFTRSGSKKATRYTVALVTWNDPADFYKPKVEYVEDRDGIARYGIQQVELTAFGCTSQGQAHRAGGWALATSRLETEGITFDVGMDGAIALPGQIVRVADPSRMGRRVGGRVRAVAGRTVTLDKAPTVKAGDRLTVVLPTGVSETRTVASVAGDAVTVSADWSTVPLAQSVWSVDSDELLAPLFRVLSVTEKDETTFTITAVQHEPGKYAYVENGTAITPRPETSTDLSKQAPPASVSLAGYTISLNDVQKLALQISCAPVSGAVAYEGAYRRGNDNWIAIPRQPSPTMDVLDILPGTYIAKMAAVNSIGVTSVETLSAAVEITKDGISRSAALLLTSDAPAFHTNTSGVTDPATITFTAELIALEGTVTWSLAGGVLSNINGKTAQLRFVDMALAAATVTASVTMYGRTYTKTLRVTKMQDGMDGVDGVQTAVVRLYQFSNAVPSKPTGNSMLVWANAANTNYTGTDGWGVAAGSNPGTPGVRLYVASVSVAAPASATSTQVGYANALVEAWSANGANGASGLHSGSATVYQWAATIPAAPVGAAEYTWASSSFGAAPAGWTLTSGDAPAPGMTLWAAKVALVDSASNATTSFNWVAAAIMAVGYAGTSGSSGASYVTAYCASATPTSVGVPDPTTGKASVPAPNSAGIVGGWSKNVPELAAGQYMYQSDGIYNPATDKVTWSTPYWSSLKVGSLSAISANLGQVTAGDINIGNGVAHIDPAGNALFKSIEIQDQNGNTILKSGGKLAPAALPDGTLNAELLPIVYQVANNNLIDLSWWVEGGHIDQHVVDVNGEVTWLVQVDAGPRGVADVVAYAQEKTLATGYGNPNIDGTTQNGGGWNSYPIQLDPTKTYRFVVPIRRVSGAGQAFWGTGSVCALNTTTLQENPYFAISANLSPDRWYLFVGYIYPAGSTGHTNDGAGVWDCKLGVKSAPGVNYNFYPGNGSVVHRAYQYYATTGAEQLFGRPMINVADGTEPPIDLYFEAGAKLNNAITLSPDGTLVGAGGGKATLPGMGQNVYRVFATGGAAPPSVITQSGLYKNGQGVYPATRSYYVAMIRRSDGVIVQAADFDVYGGGAVTGGRDAGTMATLLNAYGSDHIAVIWTCDEPFTNRMTGGLDQAMYRCGASRAIFGSPNFLYRSAYILVGIPGCGEGNGAEAYQGSVGNDPNAWCEMSITLANGAFTVSAGYTPRSLVDYGYVGALDATKGATLGVDVGGQITKANASTYIQSAALDVALIDKATITSLSALTATIGTLRTATSGGRLEFSDNVQRCFATNNMEIITFGYLG